MNLIKLENEEREAALSFYDLDALLNFHDFCREIKGEARTEEGGAAGESPTVENWPKILGEMCRRLSDIYVGVLFEPVNHHITTKVKDDTTGTLVEQLGLVSPQIPYLETTIIYESDSIQIIFRADRVGVIRDDEYYEFFEHDLNPEEIRKEYDGDQDSIDDFLRDYFEEHINPQLEDSYLDSSSLEDCSLYFEKGSWDELERLIKLMVLTEPNIEAHEDEEVRVDAATDNNDAYLENDGYYYSKRLNELVELALSENRPIGWTWDYNDGAGNRESGYGLSAECLSWTIGELIEQSTAREKMAARRELRKWLEERGQDLKRFDAMAKKVN